MRATRAMILAAGKGSRLGALTERCAKPMLPVGGRPLLEYTLALLARHGVTEVVINTHHDPWGIYDHFGYPIGEDGGIEIRYSWEKELLGTAGAVRKVIDQFPEPFWVVYGDNLLDVDLRELERQFVQNNASLAIGLCRHPHPSAASEVRWAPGGQIIHFREKPVDLLDAPHLTWSSAGVYLADPEIIRSLALGRYFDFGRDLLPQWVQHWPVYGLPLEGTIVDIGTPSGYTSANELTRWPWQRKRFLRRKL